MQDPMLPSKYFSYRRRTTSPETLDSKPLEAIGTCSSPRRRASR